MRLNAGKDDPKEKPALRNEKGLLIPVTDPQYRELVAKGKLNVSRGAFFKTTSPGVGDDRLDGYRNGDRWIDTVAQTEWVLIDNTDGAAVWVDLGGGGGLGDHNHVTAGDGGVLTDDEHDGYSAYADDGLAATPAANTTRLQAIDWSGLSSRLVYRTDDGLVHLLDNPPGNRETVGQGLFLGYIGNDAEHTTDLDFTADRKAVFGPFYCANDMALSQGFMRIRSSAGTVSAKMVVYADNGSGAPGALLAESTELTGIGSTFTWREFAFTTGTLQGGTTYWIGVHNAGANTLKVAIHDSFGADWDLSQALEIEYAANTDTYAGGASDPFGAPTTQIERLGQVYVTGAGGVSDHGLLTGLGDDDHTQYILKSLLTTRGDMIRRNATIPERFAVGLNGMWLKSDGTDPGWSAPVFVQELVDLSAGADKVKVPYLATGNVWNRIRIKMSSVTVSEDHNFTVLVNGVDKGNVNVVATTDGNVATPAADFGVGADGQFITVDHDHASHRCGGGSHSFDEGGRIWVMLYRV